LSEIDIKTLISNKDTYNIIRILRDGPLKEQTINKYLSSTSKANIKSIVKILKNLEKSKFITSFALKNENYFLLIKDFYLIRIPPKDLLEFIQKKSDIPKTIRERYLTGVRQFFSSYVKSSNKLITDFEVNLIGIIRNPEITNLLNLLRKKPLDLKSFKKKCSDYEIIKDLLTKLDIIEIISERDKPGTWVFLKTDLSFNIFFPEYLIKSITENLNNKKINKFLALKSLYMLKRSYLLNEKPEMYEELNKRILNKLEIIKALEDKGEKPIDKALELRKLYKQIGDFDNRRQWQKKLKEWKEQNN
jgi:hypothetical protein